MGLQMPSCRSLLEWQGARLMIRRFVEGQRSGYAGVDGEFLQELADIFSGRCRKPNRNYTSASGGADCHQLQTLRIFESPKRTESQIPESALLGRFSNDGGIKVFPIWIAPTGLGLLFIAVFASPGFSKGHIFTTPLFLAQKKLPLRHTKAEAILQPWKRFPR